MKTRKDKWCTAQLLTTCWLMPSPFPSTDQPPSRQLPQFIHWAWHSMVGNIPLASLGQQLWLWSLPVFLHLLTGGEWDSEKSLTQSKHCSATTKASRVINIILILNPKRSTVPAPKKKMSSVLSEARTGSLKQFWKNPAPQPFNTLDLFYSLRNFPFCFGF